MRKTCVRWAKPVLATLTIIVIFGMHWSNSTVSAQSAPNPLTLPRLAFSDFTYQGGFRLPAVAQGDDFSYGGAHMAYNPARNSLFVSSLHHKVAEVTIPAPANTNVVTQMPFASYLQTFSDPSEGHLQQMSPTNGGVLLGGLQVQGNRLYASGYLYYDGANVQRLSHFSHSTNLSEPSFVGLSQVWDTARAGFVGGYMANVPTEWQSVLGGPALTGQCCIPVISRTSYGPAAFAFDPANIGGNTAVSATPLAYYPADHTTLGIYEGANENFGASTMMGGAAVIAGTRTALFIGRIGTGSYCYGEGVSDPALNGTRTADGVMRCYDPTNATKGPHEYPYRYQMWAYDLADFAAVKSGAKQPWDVVPYAVWPFQLPTPEQAVQIGGVAYDAQHQTLYISQMYADLDGCCDRRPVVHALKINIGSSTASSSLSSTTSSTTTTASAPVSSVALNSNLPAPQPAGSNIVWTATPTSSDSGALVYKWYTTNDGGTWNAVGGWTSSNQFSWTPTAANPNYRVSAWVKHASNSADAAEASAERPFPISDAVATSTPVSSVALTTNMSAPQPAGSTIVWTATQAGGTGALVYKWFVTSDGGTWSAVGSWSSSNQFAWTPTVASPNYAVSVWVKRASNVADAAEASTYKPFTITAPVSTPVSSVALTTNVAAPQPTGSTIVWTATQSGGTGALVYKWFVTSDGGAWNAVGTWTASNQFTWTPAVASPNYAVSVWVKRATNAADEAEASTYKAFAIFQPSLPVDSVALTTDLPAPQEVSSTIVWTAVPVGGTGPLVYKWFVSSDGGTWNAVGTWTASNQFTWTPAVPSANYLVSAWVKRASNPADAAEASTYQAFPIQDPVTSVALATNLTSPQPVSSTILWTATPTGGAGDALLFKWSISSDDGVTWTAAGPWSASNQLSWTATAVNSKYRVTVWVKHATNPSDYPEASAQRRFAIKK